MLQELTQNYILHVLLIFSRFSVVFALFPALGDRYVFMRARLALAFSLSVILNPIVTPYLSKYTSFNSEMLQICAIEFVTGFMIGLSVRTYLLSLHMVGHIIAMQSGLGAATLFDPEQRAQVAIFSDLLFLSISVLILASDTHYLLIDSVIDSYKRFPVGELLDMADLSKFISYVVNNSFIIAFKISSPFLIISLVILVGSGMLSRVMPNLQVFFVITPAQILIIFSILYITTNNLLAAMLEVIRHNMQWL